MQNTAEQTPMSRTCAILISAGLVYLAVPNLLFLAGWFTPPVAWGAGSLIALYVARGCMTTVRGALPKQCDGKIEWGKLLLSAGLALLLTLYFLTDGIVGIFHSHADYYIFRQALFCNLRDAAWPLVLPNGREMSYYIANVLPPALMARMLPESWGQWCIVFWSSLPVWLALLIISCAVGPSFRSKGRKLALIVLLFFTLRDPLYIVFHSFIGRNLHDAIQLCGADCCVLLCPNARIPAVVEQCACAYNSIPPALLAVAIMLCGGRKKRSLVPLAYSLLVACSPLACIGLFPLAAILYYRAWKEEHFPLTRVVVEFPLPLAMFFLCGLYYLRAESNVFIAFAHQVWGWENALWGVVRVVLSCLLLVFPLARIEKHNGLFLLSAMFLLVAHLLFLGSPETMNNELWLKCAPPYMLIIMSFWVKDWHVMPRVKYLVIALGLIGTVHACYKSFLGADLAHYGKAADIWNGHLNHDHPFLYQSVPLTHEPAVPRVLLRQAGESEIRTPGSLIPRAPGCDYSRPVNRKLLEIHFRQGK